MAIMTQVHVRLAQFSYAKKQLRTAKRYHDTQVQIAEQTRLSWIGNRTGVQALIRERVTLVVAELRYDAARANLEASYANLLASLGEDALPPLLTGFSVGEIADALRVRWEYSPGSV